MFRFLKRQPQPVPMVRLVLDETDVEHCEDCREDAARGYMLVAEMRELFTRACGYECTCRLDFNVEFSPADLARAQMMARKVSPELFALMEGFGIDPHSEPK